MLICGTALMWLFFFFFNDTATTEIYTLSLHDALPISPKRPIVYCSPPTPTARARRSPGTWRPDRKSTRLNSSHLGISYAVFCLKKKKYTLNKRKHARVRRHKTDQDKRQRLITRVREAK